MCVLRFRSILVVRQERADAGDVIHSLGLSRSRQVNTQPGAPSNCLHFASVLFVHRFSSSQSSTPLLLACLLRGARRLAPTSRSPATPKRTYTKPKGDTTFVSRARMRPYLLKGHERPLTQVKYNREGDLFVSCAKVSNTQRCAIQRGWRPAGRCLTASVL